MLELLLDFHNFPAGFFSDHPCIEVRCIPPIHGSEMKTAEKVKVVFVEIQREL